MNWFHLILAFFGMYNDFSIEYIWKKRSVCIVETKCWFGWFFVHIPQEQSKDMVWNTFNFPFPQRIKLNQFRMQITKDYRQRNKSGSYKIVENFFPKYFYKISSTNLFFCTIPDFFSPSLEGQVGQSVGHQFVTRGVGSFDLVSFVTGTSSLKMEKVKYIRQK